eukprot:3100007-Prymnesium_polylepis.3
MITISVHVGLMRSIHPLLSTVPRSTGRGRHPAELQPTHAGTNDGHAGTNNGYAGTNEDYQLKYDVGSTNSTIVGGRQCHAREAKSHSAGHGAESRPLRTVWGGMQLMEVASYLVHRQGRQRTHAGCHSR